MAAIERDEYVLVEDGEKTSRMLIEAAKNYKKIK